VGSDTGKAFWEEKNIEFGAVRPGHDFLHPEFREREPAAELTETQYLGFNIPEHDIHGLCYLWHHPNLGVVSGGAWAWQGIKRHNLQCEIFDMVTYIDDAVLADDLHKFELPNGYGAVVEEPLKRLRIHYADAARGNAIDIGYEALMEPMVMANELHFEQAMRTRGTVTLGGREFEVDGVTVRDRSWGAVRREVLAPVPPMAWMTGVFGKGDDTWAFGTTAFDHPDTDPDWKGSLEIPGGDPTRGGWVLRGGELVPVVSSVKRTIRNRETLFPERVEMTITDAHGRDYELTGRIKAAANWRTWHNMDSIICLTEWESEGRTGHGDTQDVLFADYIRRFAGR
jgi:hypothetical protein